MISEVDVRDWDKIDVVRARAVLDDMDDLSRMNVGVVPIGQYAFFKEFIDTVETIQKRQVKQVAALLRKPPIDFFDY